MIYDLKDEDRRAFDEWIQNTPGSHLLDHALYWINQRGLLEIHRDADHLTAEVARRFKPEDVFQEGQLDTWAKSNGYIPEDEAENYCTLDHGEPC